MIVSKKPAGEKTIKVQPETHRLMSMKAADLSMKKEDMTDALLRAGLSLSDTDLEPFLIRTSHGNAKKV